MRPKLGINGFGRIGRMVLRAAIHKKLQVVAINDPYMTLEQLCYLFKHDSTHGPYKGEVYIKEDQLVVDKMKIAVFNMKEPKTIRWGSVGAEYIIEASGVFTTIEKASGHFELGAKKVIIAAPSADARMLVMGVNHKEYKPSEDKVISNGSCTTNCLAPLVKILNDRFGLVGGLMTTIHAIVATQKSVDSATVKNWRDGRMALHNIIPTSTGAASKAIGRIIPSLGGKLHGMAFRVPIKDVSVLYLDGQLEKHTDFDDLCKHIKELAEGRLKGIIGYTEDLVVSSDFLGDTRSCIFDVKASIYLGGNFFKLVAWYDNEVGYAHRVVDLVMMMAERDLEYKADSKTA